MPRRLITVQDAATLVRRAPSRVYAWIREDRLCTWEADDGTLRVDATEVLELANRMTRRKNNTTRAAA